MQKIELTKEVKKQIISHIKKYFSVERDEDIGDLSAELMLDFIIEHIGPFFYNQGINDAHSYITEKLEDLYGLEKRPRI